MSEAKDEESKSPSSKPFFTPVFNIPAFNIARDIISQTKLVYNGEDDLRHDDRNRGRK